MDELIVELNNKQYKIPNLESKLSKDEIQSFIKRVKNFGYIFLNTTDRDNLQYLSCSINVSIKKCVDITNGIVTIYIRD